MYSVEVALMAEHMLNAVPRLYRMVVASGWRQNKGWERRGGL